MDWANVFERAGWTFLQAGLASVPAAFSVGDLTDKEWWLALGVAGLSALFSFIKTVAQEQLKKGQTQGI